MSIPIGSSPNSALYNPQLPPDQQSREVRDEMAAENLAWALGESGIKVICLWTDCLSGSPYERILRRALALTGSIRRPMPLHNRHLTVTLQKLKTLDPGKAMSMTNLRALAPVYEGLLRPPLGDGPLRPGLATHYDVSPDGLQYTFHLRPGILWSDGKPITADDVVYAWWRVLSPQTASQAADMFHHVKNARAFLSGTLTDFSQVGIHAPNPQTVEVTLDHPLPAFPRLLFLAPFAPVPRHIVEKWGGAAFDPERIVVSGPFVPISANLDHEVMLARNPRYWNNAQNPFDKMTLYLTESNRTALDWYKVGKVDWVAENLSPDLVREVHDNRIPGLFTSPTEAVELMIFNCKQGPFADKALRQSVAAALDRDDFARTLAAGTRRPATSVVADSFTRLGYGGAAWPQRDPAVAPLGRLHAMGQSLEFYFYTDDYNRLLAEVVQRQLQQNMGVSDIQLTNMERHTFLTKLIHHDFSAALFTNWPDYSDPSYYLNCFRTGNIYNAGQYSNPAYDALMAQVDRTADPAARNALMQKAEAILADDLPILPLFFVQYNAMLRPSLTGFVAGATLIYRADDLRIPY